MYNITTGKSTFSTCKSNINQYYLATKTTSHNEKPWCLSDFAATLKFRQIPRNRFRIILLFAYLCAISFTLNHISLATEETNQEEYNVIDELVVNNRNKYK